MAGDMSTFRWINKQAAFDVPFAELRKIAAEVLAGAVARCPQDTGNLARSIDMREDGTGARRGFVVGTNVHYAPHVEFGTKHMAAQPYLGPALLAAKRRRGL